MLVLSFVWLALLVMELVWGLNRALWLLGQAIWIAFIAEFAVALALAPDKLRYVRRNCLQALALAAPALRSPALPECTHWSATHPAAASTAISPRYGGRRWS
jgi:hypothetical protein